MNEWIREPAVAGRFYPADSVKLNAELERCLPSIEEKRRPQAILAPHAGYVYSGAIAGQVYGRIEVPGTVVILSPNHTGMGRRISLWAKGAWRTPLGEAPVAETEAAELLELLGERPDREAHRFEHAAEVHVPFLQHLNPAVRIVPLVLGGLSWDRVREVGERLGQWLASRPDVLVVASTDMSHFIPAAEARRRDELALACVDRADGEALYRVVAENDISMCGVIPTAAALAALRLRGVTRGERLAYATSGEVTGDDSSVVAYASAWFFSG